MGHRPMKPSREAPQVLYPGGGPLGRITAGAQLRGTRECVVGPNQILTPRGCLLKTGDGLSGRPAADRARPSQIERGADINVRRCSGKKAVNVVL